MEKINQEQRAWIVWDILTTEFALNKRSITYGDLGEKIGIDNPRDVGGVLVPVQDYCLSQKLPPLRILVINKKSGLPGKGFIAWDMDDLEEGKIKVHHHNWQNETNPFEYARDGLTKNELITELLDNPDDSGAKYALTKVRGVIQPNFRQKLLRAYNCQ